MPGFKTVPLVRVVADSHLRTRATASVVATATEAADLVPGPRRHRPGRGGR